MKSTKIVFIFLIPLILCICTMSLFIIYLRVYWASNPTRKVGAYCEVSTAAWFIEPINTWSNLDFIIVGLTVTWQLIWGTFKENVNGFTRSSFMSIFCASLIICLGPCSMFMYATYTQVGYNLMFSPNTWSAPFSYPTVHNDSFIWAEDISWALFYWLLSSVNWHHVVMFELQSSIVLRIYWSVCS